MTHPGNALHSLQRFLSCSLLALVLALCTSPSQAQTCTATAVAPAFGVYSPSGGNTFANGVVSVSCNVLGVVPISVFYTIRLGLGSQPTGQQRQLAGGPGGAGRLQYNLYCDSGYTQVWADGSASSCVVSGGQALLLGSLLTPHPVYGLIISGQYVSAGSYSDVIAVDVLY